VSGLLAKNTFYLTAASIGQKAVAFFYFLALAKTMGPEHTGAYFLALSITTIFSVIADFGLTPVIIREIAKQPRKEGTLLVRRAITLKIPFILLGGVGSILASLALGYDVSVILLVAVATLVLAADAISLLYYGVLRGSQCLSFESAGIFIGQILTLLFGGAVLLFHPSLPWLVAALLVGSLFNAFFSVFQVIQSFGKNILQPLWDLKGIRVLLRLAFPFALAGTFVKVYSSIDSLFLSHFAGTAAVGVYSVAYKFTYAFQFLPMAFIAALYPGMSAIVGKDPEQLAALFNRAMWYLAILAMPITLGLSVVASDAVRLAGSDYDGAAPVLRVLVFVLMPIFLDFPVGSLLNAADRQGTKTAIMGITMVINVILNAIFIPFLGAMGAALSALVSFWFLFLAGLAFVPSVIPGYRWTNLFRTVIPIIASGLVMALTAWFIRERFGFIPSIILGAIVYVLMLFLTRAVRSEDVQSIRRLLLPSKKMDETYAELVTPDA